MSREGAEKHKLSLGEASRRVWLEGKLWAGVKQVNGSRRERTLDALLSGLGRRRPKNAATQVSIEVQGGRTSPVLPSSRAAPGPVWS